MHAWRAGSDPISCYEKQRDRDEVSQNIVPVPMQYTMCIVYTLSILYICVYSTKVVQHKSYVEQTTAIAKEN